MAQELGIKKPQICQAGSAETFEGSCTAGAEHIKISFILTCRSSQYYNNFVENDHPSYSDFSERAPWALVAGVETLNSYYVPCCLNQNRYRPGKAQSISNIFRHD